MQAAVLFSEMTPDAAWEEEFNAWYDEEHIPVRMAAPGFRGAQRYRRNERDYLAVYDMSDLGALATPAYEAIKAEPSELTRKMLSSVSGFTRYPGRPIGEQASRDWQEVLEAPVLYPVFFAVPSEWLEEFDAWYDQDHVPTLLQDENWLGCRRFHMEPEAPGAYNRLALHYIESAATLESEARKRARASTWREKLAVNEWFKGNYMLFERHGPRFNAKS
jgi:hypothetical protein